MGLWTEYSCTSYSGDIKCLKECAQPVGSAVKRGKQESLESFAQSNLVIQDFILLSFHFSAFQSTSNKDFIEIAL